jgi:hypothetical protein
MKLPVLLTICSLFFFSCQKNESTLPALSQDQVPLINNGSYIEGTINTQTKDSVAVQYSFKQELIEDYPFFSFPDDQTSLSVTGKEEYYSSSGSSRIVLKSEFISDVDVTITIFNLSTASYRFLDGRYFKFYASFNEFIPTPEDEKPILTQCKYDSATRTLYGNLEWKTKTFEYKGSFKMVDIKQY